MHCIRAAQWLTCLIVPVCFLAASAAGGSAAERPRRPEEADAEYVAEVEDWRSKRVARLTALDGWLTLVGLEWLKEGEQTFGSASNQDIVLPKGQANAGLLRLAHGLVSIEVDSGVQITHNGEPVRAMYLDSDQDGAPTVLEYGDLTFFLIRRGERFGLRIKDRNSETLTAFEGLSYFPIDRNWLVSGRLERSQDSQIDVPSALGGVAKQKSPGRVVFTVSGQEVALDALEGGDENEVFIVFGDQTNGKSTYGGGRFLYAKVDGDRVTMDFNHAYNPPCVFTAYATCPLPPPQNRLPLSVLAGEKRPSYASH